MHSMLCLTAFLKGVEELFPTLLVWDSYCYGGEPAYFWTGETILRRVAGAQQGDSLGPLLFAFALQPVILEPRKQLQITSKSEGNDTRDVFNVWHLDDGYMIAKHELRSGLLNVR